MAKFVECMHPSMVGEAYRQAEPRHWTLRLPFSLRVTLGELRWRQKAWRLNFLRSGPLASTRTMYLSFWRM